MENYFNNKGIFALISKWKYHILIIMIVSAIVASIFSSSTFIKPKYKSVSVVYPVNLGSYSEESHTEQMQQILMSQDIKDNVIKQLELDKHYGIDKNYKHYISTLYYEYGNNINISKTEFESIQITALDTDPQMACNIINSIIEFYNDKISLMHSKKHQEVVDIKSREMIKKQKEIDELHNQLNELSEKYGLLHYDIQLEELTKGYVKLISTGKENSKSLIEIKTILDNFKNKGGKLKELSTKISSEYDTYVTLKEEYDIALAEVEKKITYAQIISAPFPADKKSYPVRWLIVIFSVFGTFIMSIIIISIIESLKKSH